MSPNQLETVSRPDSPPAPHVSRRAPAGPRPTTPVPRRPPRDPRVPPPPPTAPTWAHRLVPATVRGALAGLGWWENPIPQPPSGHLDQVLAVLEKYGWCQSLDTDPLGRMCIRGAQGLLERTGHVTPAVRDRAVDHMQTALAQAGITMQFFTWNDLPGQEFSHVTTLITRAARHARQIGE
ncbi:DUF6197 family protein [Streptomyces sp. CB02261]|uniref:DUF6197 family protein n=1 Tax=Streptomyces sp. CB02261 TaxID=1703940 RepID=UPI000AC09643|nr:hypothetical protein [Streptomyces sp. CB02261]